VLDVAVVDPLPLFRQGAATVLSAAGHRVEVTDDVLSWAGSRQSAVVLLTLFGGPDWQLLTHLHDQATAIVIAVIQDLHPAALRAVHQGARSVLSRACDPAVLLRTVEATADGQAVLPAELLTALTGVSAHGLQIASEQRLSWLRQLAAGATVAQVAATAGYSERAMFRILKQLYRDMGVQNRMQAVLRAQDLGWVVASVQRP
jgi:DNA-binding NarL/FixJ family response regulator